MEAGADTSSAAAAAAAVAVAPNLVSSDDMRSGHAGQGAAPTGQKILTQNAPNCSPILADFDGRNGVFWAERSAATRRWWGRPLADWPEDELLLATGSTVVAELRAEVGHPLPIAF